MRIPRFARVLLGVFVVGLLLLAIAPFLVPVDRFRPAVVEAVNERLHGTLELGEFSLSLWGKVAVRVARARIIDAAGAPVLASEDVSVEMPVASLWGGVPEVSVRIGSPQLSVRKDAQGHVNLQTLLKTSPVQPEVPPAPDETASTALPEILQQAALHLHVHDAELTYQDPAGSHTLSNLSLDVTDASLSRPMDVRLRGQLASAGLPSGTVEVRGRVTPVLESEQLQAVRLDDAQLDVLGLVLLLEGEVNGLNTSAAPGLVVRADAERVRLRDWAAVAPALASFHAEATATLALGISGTVAAPVVDGLELRLKGPGSDFRAALGVSRLEPLRASLKIRSSTLNVSTLYAADPAAQPAAEAAEKDNADADAAFAALRTNPMLQRADIRVNVEAGDIRTDDNRIRDVQLHARWLRGRITVSRLQARAFKGSLTATASLDVRPKLPRYTFSTSLKGIDLNAAAAGGLEGFENTVVGLLSADVKGSGASLVTAKALPALKASGTFEVRDARLKNVDIIRPFNEGVNGSLVKSAQSVPVLKSVRLRPIEAFDAAYRRVGSTFTVDDGVAVLPDFRAESLPKQGIDFAGRTRITLATRALAAHWRIVDTHDLAKASGLNVSAEGVRVEGILSRPGQPFGFPVTVRGTLDAPEYQYTELPAHFTKVAGENVARAAGNRVRDAAMKALPSSVKDQAGGALKRLRGLF